MTMQQAAGASGTDVTRLRMVIGGETVDAADGATFEIVNPATGKVIATAPLGGRADVDREVEAAAGAFEHPAGWAGIGRELGMSAINLYAEVTNTCLGLRL